MEENIYIPLLEDHRELPTREAVLSRFRQAFFLRLERGSRRGGEVPVEPLLMPATEALADAVPDEWSPEPAPDADDAAWDEGAAELEGQEPAETSADVPQDDSEEPAESLFRFDEPEEAPADEGTDDGGLFGDFDEGEPSPEDDDRH